MLTWPKLGGKVANMARSVAQALMTWQNLAPRLGDTCQLIEEREK
jgi:DNA polymerase II small subunit/DNA polymerase delta subunit B